MASPTDVRTRTGRSSGLSEHSATVPPMMTTSGGFVRRWEIATREREKRQCRRRSLHCPVQMILERDGSESRVIEAECVNVGDGGLFAIVPSNANAAIGQRYTFRLNIGERGPEPGRQQCASQQGEIIRLELLLGCKGYAVGIGVRLFGPRSGIVPMPAMG